MAVMDMLKRFIGKSKAQNHFEEDQRIQERWLEKKKSANERELDRFLKEEREEDIKRDLEYFRAKRKRDNESHKILETKNMFAHEKSKMLNGKGVMKNDQKLLNGGNMFFHGK